MRLLLGVVALLLLPVVWLGTSGNVHVVGRAPVPSDEPLEETVAPYPEVDPGPRPPADEQPQRELAEEQEPPEEWDEPPEDAVERGPCSLVLQAVDLDTGTPIELYGDLWRLDAPGNELWTRGDQLQAHVTVKPGGTQVDNLPAGDYRVHATSQRRDTDDPPTFGVEGALTHRTLRIPLPREHRVFLKVFDENGRLVRQGVRTDGLFSSSSSGAREKPPWLEERRLRRGECYGGMGIVTSCGGLHPSEPQFVEADDRGFFWGIFPEDDRSGRTHSIHSLQVEARNRVSLFLKCDVPHERTYVGVAVPVGPLREVVFLPDGRKAVEAGATIAARCPAVLETEATPSDVWRRLPIEVTVRLPGYDTLEFEYRLDRPLVARYLAVKQRSRRTRRH